MATPYHTYYAKVSAKRLKYLRNYNVILAVVLSVLLNVPYGHFWHNLLYTFAPRAPLIFVALTAVKISRDLNTTVNYSSSKTLANHLLQLLSSPKMYINYLLYVCSAFVVAAVFLTQLPFCYDYYLLSKIYQQKPQINDEWVYFWYYAALYVPLVYTLQHLVFERNRLLFKYGVNKVRPESVIFSNLTKLVGNSVGLNIIALFSGPIVYILTRSFLYKLSWLLIVAFGLDTKVPPLHVSFRVWKSTSYLSFFVFLSWELTNRLYNIYATVGCLDGTKSISTYSADPVNTLLSGLRDVEPDHELARLTAFQELAYISTSTDKEIVKYRSAFYNAHSKSGFIWPLILNECALVIKDTCSRVNYRSKLDIKALQKDEAALKEDVRKGLQDDDIFGNSFITAPASLSRTPSLKVKEYKEEAPTGVLSKIDFRSTTPYKYIEAQMRTLFKMTAKDNIFTQLLTDLEKTFNSSQKSLLSSPIGFLFRITLQRDANSRVVNAVNFGNAVISITNLLIHAIEEDKNNSITNSRISDVLNLLENPIRVFGNYTDYLPASIYKEDSDSNQHIVAVLHDVTVTEFYTLCLKYNFKLNDLVLAPKTFKLAKWVIDVAIAQQQQQQHELKQNKSELIF